MTKFDYLELLERRIKMHDYAKNAILTLLETEKFPRVYMRHIESIVFYYTKDETFVKQVFELYNTFTRGNALFEELFLNLLENEKGTTNCRPSFVQEKFHNPFETTHLVWCRKNKQSYKRCYSLIN